MSAPYKPGDRRDFVAVAEKAWDGMMPDWVQCLAECCTELSQATVAREIGYTNSAISMVLNRKPWGKDTRYSQIETKFRATFMPENVSCPIVGDISTSECLVNADKAAAKGVPVNQLQRHFKFTCPTCRFNPRNQTKEAQNG